MTRGEISRQASAILSTVPVGAFASITLPDKEPAQRIVYQKISGVAYHLWGAGNYRLEKRNDPPRLVVWRLGVKSGPARTRLPVLMRMSERLALREKAVTQLMEYMSP